VVTSRLPCSLQSICYTASRTHSRLSSLQRRYNQHGKGISSSCVSIYVRAYTSSARFLISSLSASNPLSVVSPIEVTLSAKTKIPLKDSDWTSSVVSGEGPALKAKEWRPSKRFLTGPEPSHANSSEVLF